MAAGHDGGRFPVVPSRNDKRPGLVGLNLAGLTDCAVGCRMATYSALSLAVEWKELLS
jgi:hypothetical protein